MSPKCPLACHFFLAHFLQNLVKTRQWHTDLLPKGLHHLVRQKKYSMPKVNHGHSLGEQQTLTMYIKKEKRAFQVKQVCKRRWEGATTVLQIYKKPLQRGNYKELFQLKQEKSKVLKEGVFNSTRSFTILQLQVYEILESPLRKVSKASPIHLLQAFQSCYLKSKIDIETWKLLPFAKHAQLHCEAELKGHSPSFTPMLHCCNISFNQSKMYRKEIGAKLWG